MERGELTARALGRRLTHGRRIANHCASRVRVSVGALVAAHYAGAVDLWLQRVRKSDAVRVQTFGSSIQVVRIERLYIQVLCETGGRERRLQK